MKTKVAIKWAAAATLACITMSVSALADTWTRVSGSLPDVSVPGLSFDNTLGTDDVLVGGLMIGARYGTNHFAKLKSDGSVEQAAYAPTDTLDDFVSGTIINLSNARALNADKTIQALRFNSGLTLNLGGKTLALESGGILLGGNSTISNGTLTTNGSNLWMGGASYTMTISADITNVGDLEWASSAQLSLSGSNSFSGDVVVNKAGGGSLRLMNKYALGSAANIIGGNGNLTLTIETGAKDIDIKGITVGDGRVLAIVSNADVTISGAIVRGGASANLEKSGSGKLTLSGQSTLGIGKFVVTGVGSELNITGALINTTAFDIYGGNNSSYSKLSISDNGELKTNSTGNSKFYADSSGRMMIMEINNNGKFTGTAGSASTMTIGANQSNSKTIWNQNGGTVEIGSYLIVNTTDNTTQPITATAEYNLNGGLLRVTTANRSIRLGNNSALNLNGGIIQLFGSSKIEQNATTSTGNVYVQAGTTEFYLQNATDKLTSNLPFEHDTTLGGRDGGIKKTGDGTLILTGANTYDGNTTVSAGTFQLDTNASLVFKFDSADINYIKAEGTGFVKLLGSISIDTTAYAGGDDAWTLFKGNGSAYDFTGFSLDTTGGWAGNGVNQWKLDVDPGVSYFTFTTANNGLLTFTIVPEPSTWLLLSGSAVLLAVLRRRK